MWGRLSTCGGLATDRKSTRLNSSHLGISYAVFCLKKKKTECSATSGRVLATSISPATQRTRPRYSWTASSCTCRQISSPSSSTLALLFFFNDTATTEIYTLSLHDALPIWNPSPGLPPSSHFGATGRRAQL